MKRCRQAVLKTTVLGRKGRKVIRTPLIKRNNRHECKSPHVDSQQKEHLHNTTYVLPAQALATDEQNEEGNIAKKRKIVNMSNWEKVRNALLIASIENSSFPNDFNCVACDAEEATTRCEYCGPRQYLCLKCAQEIHKNRNQFHVLEQWKVHHQLKYKKMYSFLTVSCYIFVNKYFTI